MSPTGRLQDSFAVRPGKQMMRRSGDNWDIGHACFLNSTEKHIKLTLTSYSRHYNEL